MTKTDHDAIAARVRQDREAGTPGVWDAAIESGCHAIVAAILPDGANIIALIGNSLETPERETMRFANARRIAALPDLEAAYLDLYDEVTRLRADLAGGSFYKEADVDRLMARAEKAEAERDRLRAVLERCPPTSNPTLSAEYHLERINAWWRLDVHPALAKIKGDDQ